MSNTIVSGSLSGNVDKGYLTWIGNHNQALYVSNGDVGRYY